MPETIRAFAGVKDVSFTPAGDPARPIPCLESLDDEIAIEETAHANADGAHDVCVRARRISRRVTIRSTDLAALEALPLNALGTLRWTLVGKGAAADRTLAARARVVRPVAYSGGDGHAPVVASVVLALLSDDGLTSPVH